MMLEPAGIGIRAVMKYPRRGSLLMSRPEGYIVPSNFIPARMLSFSQLPFRAMLGPACHPWDAEGRG